ncbi:hypothetical protein PR048_001643 [Dryococelus australis]|uniref:Vitellogenin n=1 Tax=Dryococelus australis TaxID=614101 RepID=A0ABQ9IHV9_9NEOP|nr:hypothetical protein PR048_001643 [Dryococelus australis]
MCILLEEFCVVNFPSSKQQEDFRETHKARHATDIAKVSLWFECHSPYVKLSQKDQAPPLASMTYSVKVRDDKVVVDPFLIFQRISITKQIDDDLKTFLQHKLTPFLWNAENKSALYGIFEAKEKNVDLHNLDIVVDGGFPLHEVVWSRGSTCSTVCQSYINFILKYYSNKSCTIATPAQQTVPTMLSRAEDIDLRSLWTYTYFGEDTGITVKQEHFLCNANNKSRLISTLSV